MTGPAEIVITGIGMVTRAGLGAPAAWDAIARGPLPPTIDPALTELPWPYSCRVPDGLVEDAVGPSRAWRYDRYTQLAYLSACEALSDAGLDPAGWDGGRVALLCGTALGGVATIAEQQEAFAAAGTRHVSAYLLPKAMTNMAAGSLAIEFGIRGPCMGVATACASGITALGLAATLLRSGQCDLALAGGAEMPIAPLFVTAMGQLNVLAPDGVCRPFGRARSGFPPGEGAAFLVLERSDHAAARKAAPLARLAGCGGATDAHHLVTPDPSGAGMAAAIRAALRDAAVSPAEIDLVHAHGTGTTSSDAAEALALCSVLGPGRPITATKGLLGHTFGASGAITVALAALGLSRHEVLTSPGPADPDPDLPVRVLSGGVLQLKADLVLCQAHGFGGQNAAAVLAAP
jgi:3-oxoacyl-[acyl-carrier-protein] synthase II